MVFYVGVVVFCENYLSRAACVIIIGYGSLAQLARAPRLHRGGRGFEPLATHQTNQNEFFRVQSALTRPIDAFRLTLLEIYSFCFRLVAFWCYNNA